MDFLAMADAKDQNDQAVVFDLVDEPVIEVGLRPLDGDPRYLLLENIFIVRL